MRLPKRLTPKSKINLVHTSSPVLKSDLKSFKNSLEKLKQNYKDVRVFEVERKDLDPRYLAASEKERLRKFRRAIRKVNWLVPIYGGTGCGDIVRYLKFFDLACFRRNRPIVNGFSDTTFLLNYLYFKIKLLTFHYYNACGLFSDKISSDKFFDIITGKKKELIYDRSEYQWLSAAGKPDKPIEGFAIGGNMSTFRDLLDICEIKPRSWEDYILFIEDVGLDMEDLHRVIVALDQRGIFMHVKALVLGTFNEKSFANSYSKLDFIFGRKKREESIFEYLISDVIGERIEDRDPLYILEVDNFGHGVEKDTMIIPIGARTIIYPSGKIEFHGPFVE